MKVRKNIGTIDSAARIIVGVVLLSIVPLAFIGPKLEWATLGFLGVFPLVAGLVRYCPPYALLGIDTYHKRGDDTGGDGEERPTSACC